MPELIDKSEISKRLCAACSNMGSFACISCAIPHIIKDTPTIEAEPVRHGRWILCEDQHGVDNDNNNYAYFCSQCHYQDVHSKYAKVNFCWNCGSMNSEV